MGHGTHVSGTIAGYQFGVAKQARIIAVKVFPDGKHPRTPTSEVIKGLEWATFNAVGRGAFRCVANMSLSGDVSMAENMAVGAAVGLGLTIVVAAGNYTVRLMKSANISNAVARTLI
jgi:oryzin